MLVVPVVQSLVVPVLVVSDQVEDPMVLGYDYVNAVTSCWCGSAAYLESISFFLECL
jgi:hypothetical protein